MKNPIIILLAALLLFGCKAEKTEVTQTVEWYTSHDAERGAMLKTCQSNPGELGATPNCINASVAGRIASARPTRNYGF